MKLRRFKEQTVVYAQHQKIENEWRWLEQSRWIETLIPSGYKLAQKACWEATAWLEPLNSD